MPRLPRQGCGSTPSAPLLAPAAIQKVGGSLAGTGGFQSVLDCPLVLDATDLTVYTPHPGGVLRRIQIDVKGVYLVHSSVLPTSPRIDRLYAFAASAGFAFDGNAQSAGGLVPSEAAASNAAIASVGMLTVTTTPKSVDFIYQLPGAVAQGITTAVLSIVRLGDLPAGSYTFS